jgi:hypothetical protein
MLNPSKCVVYSGGAAGTEHFFGVMAEAFGMEEVHYSFEGHHILRSRGVRLLTDEELRREDIRLSDIFRIMNREYANVPALQKVFQSICLQVRNGSEVFVIGSIQADGTVKGGTGWGAEFAKLCDKPLLVFDQGRDAWFRWSNGVWIAESEARVTREHFTAGGTRFLEDNGRRAIEKLFDASFVRA